MSDPARPNPGDGSPAGPLVFDRPAARAASEIAPPAPQVIERDETSPVNPDDHVVTSEEGPAAEVPAPSRRARNWGVVVALVGIAAFALERLMVDAASWIGQTYQYNVVLGLIAIAALVAGLAGAIFVIVRELRSFFALKSVEALQGEVDQIDRLSLDAAQRLVAGVLAVVPKHPEIRSGIATFQRQVQLYHTPAQRIAILSQTVIRPLDRHAEDAIRRGATRAFGITAVSPTALTHALFFLVSCVRMMREITATYGHRPTTATTLHLMRRLVVEAGRVGGIDIAMAAIGGQFISGIVERLGAGAAEAAYGTQRMARLGILTMAMCRPIPFRKEEVPTLSSLVGNLLRRQPGTQ